jgi:hypothetical protein
MIPAAPTRSLQPGNEIGVTDLVVKAPFTRSV